MLLYIDPGSGSLILQAIIGGALGVAFFFKSLKRRALGLFGRRKKSEAEDSPNPALGPDTTLDS